MISIFNPMGLELKNTLINRIVHGLYYQLK